MRRERLDVGDEESEILDDFVRLCDILEERWYIFEDFYEGIPLTLVHGDFADENVRIKRTNTSASVMAFDWEKAGWGVPSIDLPAANAEWYRECVSRIWPDLDLGRIKQMQTHGTIWQILSHNLSRKTPKKLSRYRVRLANAICLAGMWERTL